jgi:site-specific DNA recombinase
MRNVIYKGQILHQGVPYPGEHESIISTELRERVSEQHKPGARKAKPHRKVHTLLGGFLYCGRCGSSISVTYTVRRGTQHAYYLCTGCKKRAQPSESIRPVATTDLETSLVRELEPILGDQPGEIAVIPRRSAHARDRSPHGAWCGTV